MYEKIKQIIRRLNEKAFLIGIALVASFFYLLFTFNSWEELFFLVLAFPGFLILHYSLFPDAKSAKYGKFFFDLKRSIESKDKKSDYLPDDAIDIATLTRHRNKETYNLTSERFNNLFPIVKKIKTKLNPVTTFLSRWLKPILKPIFKILRKPFFLMLFSLGVLFKILVQWPYRSIAYILLIFPFYLVAVIRFDLIHYLEFLPWDLGSELAGLLMLAVLFLPVLIYSILLWKACKASIEKEANILGIPKSWKPRYVEYSYEHEGKLYDYVMPASGHFMLPYGQLKSEFDKVELTGQVDPRNLAKTITLIINQSFPQVHCLQEGLCETLYRYVTCESLTDLLKNGKEIQTNVR